MSISICHIFNSSYFYFCIVYVTYLMQWLFIYGLYESVYTVVDGENAISDSSCNISSPLLNAAVFTFLVSMVPQYKGIIQELDMIFCSKRIAYTEDAENGNVYITNLLIPFSKRITIFLLVNLFEIVLVASLTFVGVGYM